MGEGSVFPAPAAVVGRGPPIARAATVMSENGGGSHSELRGPALPATARGPRLVLQDQLIFLMTDSY